MAARDTVHGPFMLREEGNPEITVNTIHKDAKEGLKQAGKIAVYFDNVQCLHVLADQHPNIQVT
jgi:hypothetical protein